MSCARFACLLAAAGAAQVLGNVVVLPKKPTAEPRTLMLFDCQADFLDSMRSWSAGKKAWCCKRHGVSCVRAAEHQSEQAIASADYDCMEAFANWQTEWSDGKKAWCCHHASTGCTTELRNLEQPTSDSSSLGHAPVPRDCDADLGDWVRAWSFAKKDWCCKHWGHGCGTPSLSNDRAYESFDCKADAATWEFDWSAVKREFCCGPQNMTCPPSGNVLANSAPAEAPQLPELPKGSKAPVHGMFDCDEDLADWDRAWSAPKMAWCCQNLGRGCHQEGAESPSQGRQQHNFDCNAALLNWQREWSPQKQAWCCQAESLGCLDVSV